MAEGKKRGLGRGLSALLGEDPEEMATGAPSQDKNRISKAVPIEKLHPGKYQPRHRMDEEHIRELADSIAEKGVLQPLLVRRHPDEEDAFEIIAGERRWRASQLAQLHEVPVIIKELSDQEALEIALVENLQRQDLSPLEEAEGYRRLMEEFDHTQEGLAKVVGKSRSHVANSMRLLGLDEPIKEMVERGDLSAGHARALLNADNSVSLAQQVVDSGLNVRQTEKLVRKEKGTETRGRKPAPEKDPDTLALERDLTELLGLNVDIRFKGSGGGTLTIHYGSLEQLDDVLDRLNQGDVAAAPIEEEDEEQAINIKLKPVKKS